MSVVHEEIKQKAERLEGWMLKEQFTDLALFFMLSKTMFRYGVNLVTNGDEGEIRSNLFEIAAITLAWINLLYRAPYEDPSQLSDRSR